MSFFLGRCVILAFVTVPDQHSRVTLISFPCAARSGGLEPVESSSSCSLSKIRQINWDTLSFMMRGLGLGTVLARSSSLAFVHRCPSFHAGMSMRRQDGRATVMHRGVCVFKLEEVHRQRNATVVML